MSLRALSRAYYNPDATPADSGRCPKPKGLIVPFLNSDGYNIDQRRVITHPSFRAVENEGFYQYDHNPSITRNFIYHPGRRIDFSGNKTITSNITVKTPQAWEDVIITEIWFGSDRQISALNNMFHLFYHYWNETPAVGQYVGWCPFDITTDRFLVEIVSVTLGGVDYTYQEVRKHITKTREDASTLQQLTLQLKLAKPTILPQGTITLTGI
jgi:hypothetical protein